MDPRFFVFIAMLVGVHAAPTVDEYVYEYGDDSVDLTLDDIYSMEHSSPANIYRERALTLARIR